jgi:hypothetical protein
VVAALPAAVEVRGHHVCSQLSNGAASASLAIPPDEVLKSVIAEQATMLRAELQLLASSRIEDLARPLHAMSESLQGLIVRLGNLVERAATAMEGLSLASTCVQASSAKHPVVAASSMPPPLADHNVGFEDGGEFDLFDVPVVQPSSSLLELAVEPIVTLVSEEMKNLEIPSLGEISLKELVQVDAEPSPMEELLKELEAPASHFERRSCRLDLKNKGCDIPAAKRAEYRRAEAFGEAPKVKSKGKGNEQTLDEKMQYYLQMYKKQHDPQAVEAIRALTKVNA